MITIHPSFPAPTDPNISLWRYMDLSKFVWMLQHRALYYCRLDGLGDPYEGHYTRPMPMLETAFVQNMEAMIRADSKIQTNQEPSQDLHESLRVGFWAMLKSVQQDKVKLFVSCWHSTKRSQMPCGSFTHPMVSQFAFELPSRFWQKSFRQNVWWVVLDISTMTNQSSTWVMA